VIEWLEPPEWVGPRLYRALDLLDTEVGLRILRIVAWLVLLVSLVTVLVLGANRPARPTLGPPAVALATPAYRAPSGDPHIMKVTAGVQSGPHGWAYS
jgi:hypothetical protein